MTYATKLKLIITGLLIAWSICLVFAVKWVVASPFLIVDTPTVPPDYYMLDLPGFEGPHPYPLHVDIGTITIGGHTVRAQGCVNNVWNECSPWSDQLDFTRPGLPSVPGAPGLVAE